MIEYVCIQICTDMDIDRYGMIWISICRYRRCSVLQHCLARLAPQQLRCSQGSSGEVLWLGGGNRDCRGCRFRHTHNHIPLPPKKMRKQITIYCNMYKLPLNFIVRFWFSIFLGVAGGQSGGNMRKPCILLLLESIFRTYMHISRAWFKTQDLSTRRFWDMVMFIRRVAHQ